jgi:hypothetical protein
MYGISFHVLRGNRDPATDRFFQAAKIKFKKYILKK